MTDYPEAPQILESINKTNTVLLALHINPDSDSVGSNLALALVLKNLGKTVEIYSADVPPQNLDFLPAYSQITLKDPKEIDIGKFKLAIFLDSSDKLRITRHEHLSLPGGITTVVIDHHQTNTRFAQINLVDPKASSTGEILFNLFSFWKTKITPEIATCLLTAMAGDTGTFRWATTESTLDVASRLIKLGAGLKEINFNLYQRTPLEQVRYQAEVVRKMKIKQAGNTKFVWAATSFEEIEALGGSKFAVGGSDIGKTVEGADFTLVLREEEKGIMTGSFRSRTDIDVAKIAELFGGGGHKAAAGLMIRFNEPFKNKVEEVINKVGEYLSK
ncbi:MAG: hypothetical protein A3H88_02100 [Candidatus Blackburnbacteria bacterium RIFCSPLOWO2_02_FULL_44_9]|nr:MAG: hypothetical protein A3H88_02100 [Candidatus Blackburnbacteria bacterium RIFCSPLOWO2_02_FULL_44_9]